MSTFIKGFRMINIIKSELSRIAFLLINAGKFDKLKTTDPTRVTLEGLPVEWEDVDFSGEFEPDYYREENVWKDGKLTGKLNGKPFKLDITRGVKRNWIYDVKFEGKSYRPQGLKNLKKLVEQLHKGEHTEEDKSKKVYKDFLKKREEILKYVESNFLSKVSPEKWHIEMEKYLKPIYIRFFMWSDEKGPIENKLSVQMDKILEYLKSIMDQSVVGQFSFTYKFIPSHRKVGVVIAINMKES